MIRFVLAVVSVVLLGLPGCVAVPPFEASHAITRAELVDHVAFLASPKRKGRAPRSSGSSAARRYVAEAFEGLGLRPWPGASGFEQKFLAGTNLVGVLPGGDAELAGEFVILSAHYDHLGKHEGQVHPGASDNASGIAVLLEVAEAMTLSPDRPARSVVFVAFDAEETGLLGSYVFTGRGDFDAERLAGLVNLDMIGRATFDVLPNTLITAGTETYPELRRQVLAAGERAGVRVLPIGRDLIGPRSDHVPFEPMGRPWVFITGGPFAEYHTPADTADKLDYDTIFNTAAVAQDLVRHLADTPEVEAPATPIAGDRDELRSILTVLKALRDHPDAVRGGEAEWGRIPALLADIEAASGAPIYSSSQRTALIGDVVEVILPTVVAGELSDEKRDATLVMREFYLRYPRVMIELQRAVITGVLRHKASPFTVPDDETIERLPVNDRGVVLRETTDGRLRLSFCIPHAKVVLRYGWLGRGGASFEVSWLQGDITGSRDDVIDYLLLHLLRDHRCALRSAAWGSLLRQVVGTDHGPGRDAWRSWRLAQRGHPGEAAWLAEMLRHPNPRVRDRAVAPALQLDDPGLRGAVGRLTADPSADAEFRARVLRVLGPRLGDLPEARDWLKARLGDNTPIDPRGAYTAAVFDAGYPFYEHAQSRLLRRWAERGTTEAPATLGALAEQQLARSSQ